MTSHGSTSFVLLHLFMPFCRASFVLNHLNDKLYIEKGDLNIGGIFSITTWDQDRPCGDRVDKFYQVEVAEMMVYAVRDINKKLLRNITNLNLGYIIADACDKETAAAIQALRFVPLSNVDEWKSENSSSLATFSVIGVTGTDQSFTSKPVASVLNTAMIPLVSFWATDIALADKREYPNFHRVVSSGLDQIYVLVDFIVNNKFYYFAIIYEDDRLYHTFYEAMDKFLDPSLHCHSMELKVTSNDNFTDIVSRILDSKEAVRIVLVLAHDRVSQLIAEAVTILDAEGQLLWIGGDSMTPEFIYSPALSGSIGVLFAMDEILEFEDYFRSLDSSTKNPWFLQAMKDTYNCDTDQCIREMLLVRDTALSLSAVYNAVLVYGLALKEFLETFCGDENHFEQGHWQCFQRHQRKFPQFVTNAMHSSQAVRKSKSEISVYQCTPGARRNMKLLHNIDYTTRKMSRVAPFNKSLLKFNADMLLSSTHCMPKCMNGEYRVHFTRCCWHCVSCEEDEIVSPKLMECVHCPLNQWPGSNRSVCVEIPPNFMKLTSFVPLLLFFLSFIGVSTILTTLVWYFRNSDSEVIKASSLELSYVHLMVLLCGFLAVPVFLVEPTDFTCTVGVLMSMISFNVSYVIMLIKAIRVYRIFNMSRRNMKISFIGRAFQVLTSILFMIFEIVRFSVVNHYYPVRAQILQPDPLIKYTELTCTTPPVQLFLFFITDFTLLLMCCLLAFKTQTLPTRFKESKYVSICVVATLIVWSAMMPGFFTAVHRKSRIVLLIMALLINHTTAYVFIFFSRIMTVRRMRLHMARAASFVRHIKNRPHISRINLH